MMHFSQCAPEPPGPLWLSVTPPAQPDCQLDALWR
jgi:hypothetical protein